MSEPTNCWGCGDEFHYDDTGGYNPPCQKCGLCRDCCEAGVQFSCHEWDDEDGPDIYMDGGDGGDD